MATQLSPNFTLEERVHSDYALRHNIDNSTNEPSILAALTGLSVNILEPIWSQFGPFFPTSGYRCPQLNRAIGGAVNSQHMKGQAADIVKPTATRYELAFWLEQNLDFDQLILELYTPGQRNSGWGHCSFIERGANRKQTLTYPPATHQYIPGLRP